MTIEAGSNDGEGRGAVLTAVPRPGTVLVRSPRPPEIPGVRYVDVRPGPAATFDGDRLRLPLDVRCGGEHRRFGRTELPAVGNAVAAFLRRGGRGVVRFGDRAACRRVLPVAALVAIERRLAAAARREGETLVTWTRGDPRAADAGVYDAVLG